MSSRISTANHVALVGRARQGESVDERADPTPSPVSYLVADDHPSVTIAIRQILVGAFGVRDANIEAITTSSDLLALCGQVSGQRVVILDLVMPGDLKRAALVKALAHRDPNMRILIYTADESPFLARAALASGGLGYVAKTSPTSELMDAIAAVRDGCKYIDSHIDLDSTLTHPWSTLTDSERAVLVALCRGAKPHEIVQATGRSYSTVTTHKYNGLSKLGVRDGNDLLAYVYEHGLLHELDAD
jgi:DNA-binding NarL/FixJ family response regulator